MVQRQKDENFSSGIEYSIDTMCVASQLWWILNHLVHNDFVGTVGLTKHLSQELSKDMTMRWSMADDSYAKNFGVACWHPKGGAEDRLLPSHIIRQETNDETSRVSTQKFTELRHKNWGCKYTEDMYCDSDDNHVVVFLVINTFCTCQADVDTKMTVGMFMCMTQNEEMCTVGTSTCLSCEETPRWMSMIWFSNNTSKSGDGTD